ncbi:hypothetical protein DXG01_001545 [Tephrocybe rancida]|nr:hypothetical protein DXG01_001545 [Tephrocybe rancida]
MDLVEVTLAAKVQGDVEKGQHREGTNSSPQSPAAAKSKAPSTQENDSIEKVGWSTALRSINRSGRNAIKHSFGSIGFCFPNLRLLLAKADPLPFIAGWLYGIPSHKYTITHGLLSAVSAQHWRTYLARMKKLLGPDFDNDANEGLSSTLQPVALTLAKANCKRKRDELHAAPVRFATTHGPVHNHKHILFNDNKIYFDSRENLERDLTPEVTALIMWELYENNFRFELLTMDKLLVPTFWNEPESLQAAQCNVAILKVFVPERGANVASYLVGKFPSVNVGLAAENWRERAPYVFAIAGIMSKWANYPDVLRPLNNSNHEVLVLALKKGLASFYFQAFFNNFSHVPMLPHRLPASHVSAGKHVK